VASRCGWKVWLGGVAGKCGWKVRLEGVAGRHGWWAWLEVVSMGCCGPVCRLDLLS
jgi:hypothetical protein